MRVQVRKCPFTGKIFEEKDIKKYVLHLQALRADMQTERQHERLRATFAKWLGEEKKKVTHIDMICPWFLENQRVIMDSTNAICFGGDTKSERRNRFIKADKFAQLEFEHARYDPLADNSHTCPDNGVMNWCAKDPTKPIGYKGWKGYLKGSLVRPASHDYSYPYSEALNLVGIKTGSGGGGNKSFGYGFTIYLDDWPGLKEQIRLMEEDLIVSKLKGTK
jgi:hypothetical protein